MDEPNRSKDRSNRGRGVIRNRRRLASPTTPSWNQLDRWLREMDGLRCELMRPTA